MISKELAPNMNRSQRRKADKVERFHGESNNHHLTVLHNCKYRRRKQYIYDENGKVVKTILHYDLCKWRD